MIDRDVAKMETDLSSGSCCNVDTAIDYLVSIDNNTVIHEQTINLLKYMRDKQNGVRPKYYKASRSVYSYWRCGQCGGRKVDVGDNYCPNCGYYIKWDSPRCLTGYDEPEPELNEGVERWAKHGND